MTAPARITQAEITRAIRGAKAAGIEIGEVQVTAAGDVRIIPAGQAAPADAFEAWEQAREREQGRPGNGERAA